MATARVHGLVIEGSSAFISRTTSALNELVSTRAWSEVQPHIGKIKEAERSGMRAYDTPPTYEVGASTSTSNVFWYASTIGHDAYHSKLYHDAGRGGGRVPDEAWTGAAAEAKCNAFQLKVLNELCPRNPEVIRPLITHLEGIISSNRDYYSDYEGRDW